MSRRSDRQRTGRHQHEKPRGDTPKELVWELEQAQGNEVADPSDEYSSEHVRQRLARNGQLDEAAPWDSFVDLVQGTAMTSSGRRLGVRIRAGVELQEILTLPEPVLGNLKTFKDWLNEHGFSALVEVATDSNLKHLVGQISVKAHEVHIVLEHEGISQVKGSDVLVGCYAGQLFAPRSGLAEKLAAPATSSRSAGTLESWNESVLPYAEKAPILLYSLGLALAPAVFGFTRECLAFEVVGPPDGIDERIVAQVAASVAESSEALHHWVNVKSALTRIQEAGRCRVLALDDIGDEDRRHIAEICGEQQFDVSDPSARCAASAVLVVGTPWRTARARLNRPTWRSSHELGMPGIHAPRLGSLSAFGDETVNIAARQALAQAIDGNHGCVLPEFLRQIVGEQMRAAESFQAHRAGALGRIASDARQPLSGIERGVAARFAIVSATLELAIQYKVLHLSAGQGSRCCESLFTMWLKHWRSRYEDAHRSAAVSVQEALRARLGELPAFDDACTEMPLGFRGAHEQEDLIWIFSEHFSALCGDHDRAACLDALDHYGMLKKAGKGKQLRKRLPSALVASMGSDKCNPVDSFYAIRSSFLEAALG